MSKNQKKQKLVNFQITRGIRLQGKSYYPKYKKDGTLADDSPVVKIAEALARDLTAASKGMVTDKSANINVQQEKTEEELDAEFLDGGE